MRHRLATRALLWLDARLFRLELVVQGLRRRVRRAIAVRQLFVVVGMYSGRYFAQVGKWHPSVGRRAAP